MRREISAMLVALCLVPGLVGCAEKTPGSTKNTESMETQMPTAPRQTEETGQETIGSTDPKKCREAYQFALQQIAFEHIYPDGTDTGFDGDSGFIEDNHFALTDINRDGQEELIVQFVTAPMAGNIETVYAYREEDDTMEPLLRVFPAVTYYDNGVVKAEWSHGSALAGEDYWPYDLYRYRQETGTYVLMAQVDMWSREMGAVDAQGNPYPEDVDKEHSGTVFLLTRDGARETVSREAYAEWLEGVTGNAGVLTVPYQGLTEENIRAMGE